MPTKANHRWRRHKTKGRVIFKSKDKAHKEKHFDNVWCRIEKEVLKD